MGRIQMNNYRGWQLQFMRGQQFVVCVAQNFQVLLSQRVHPYFVLLPRHQLDFVYIGAEILFSGSSKIGNWPPQGFHPQHILNSTSWFNLISNSWFNLISVRSLTKHIKTADVIMRKGHPWVACPGTRMWALPSSCHLSVGHQLWIEHREETADQVGWQVPQRSDKSFFKLVPTWWIAW